MLNEFWSNFQRAAGFMTPVVIADSPALKPDEIRDCLARATIWLTPKSVEGFDPDDFQFLMESERQELCKAVAGFRAVAATVPPDKPATDEQVDEALPKFIQIRQIVALDRYSDPDAFRIGKLLESRIANRVPSVVDDLKFETGTDTEGGKALWIWVVLKEESPLANMTSVRDLLDHEVRDLGTGYWPYIRFRTVADLQPVTR